MNSAGADQAVPSSRERTWSRDAAELRVDLTEPGPDMHGGLFSGRLDAAMGRPIVRLARRRTTERCALKQESRCLRKGPVHHDQAYAEWKTAATATSSSPTRTTSPARSHPTLESQRLLGPTNLALAHRSSARTARPTARGRAGVYAVRKVPAIVRDPKVRTGDTSRSVPQPLLVTLELGVELEPPDHRLRLGHRTGPPDGPGS